MILKKCCKGNFLVVQCLGLCTLTAKGPNSVSGWGTKIPQAAQHGPPPKKKNSAKNSLCSLKSNDSCLFSFLETSSLLSLSVLLLSHNLLLLPETPIIGILKLLVLSFVYLKFFHVLGALVLRLPAH